MTTKVVDELVGILSLHAEPLSIKALQSELKTPISSRTLRRWLKLLSDKGIVRTYGQYKSSRYQLVGNIPVTPTTHPFFSTQSLKAIGKVRRPVFQRDPCSYHESWLKSYEPNQNFYLTGAQRENLFQNSTLILEGKSADTYTHKIFNRLLIDLSYNSSRLEGNTYSLVETQKLVIENQAASGKLDMERVMILNHKEAIRFLVEGIHRITIDVDTIRTMHYLLADGLVLASDAGQIRHEAVRVSLTTYAPIEGQQRLGELLALIIEKAAKIVDPFEQSFFLLVHISYLQAFIDINKRTARLCANIPFVKNNLTPLSFNDIDKDDYISAIISIYEYNDTTPLAELYVWSYLRSSKQYQTLNESIGIDVIHVRYREQRRQLITQIIQKKITSAAMADFIKAFAKENIPRIDYDKFIENAQYELEHLESFKISGLGISQREFAAWKKLQ